MSMQPNPATPVCCYCDADLACSHCGMEQPDEDVSALKVRVLELEANEAAYEAILGKRTYNEVADHIMGLESLLSRWVNIALNGRYGISTAYPLRGHPIVDETQAALSHAGPDGEQK